MTQMSQMTQEDVDGIQEDSRMTEDRILSRLPSGLAASHLRLCDICGTPIRHARAARVSLTMIVRDEEKNLPHCLGSVRGIFDEIVVVDTGSADRTGEIARAFGARVFDFVWVDDFAAARTRRWRARPAIMPSGSMPTTWSSRPSGRSCGRCSTDLRAGRAGRLRRAMRLRPGRGRQRRRDRRRPHPALPAPRRRPLDLSRPRADPAGPAPGRHPRALDRPDRAAHRLCRPGPPGPEARPRRPDPAARSWTTGPTTRSSCSTWARSPSSGRTGARRWDISAAAWRGSAPSDSITRKLFALIARAHQMLGDTGSGAARSAPRGWRSTRRTPSCWFRKAVVHRHRGESAEAERCWRRILTLRRPEQFASVDQGIYGHLTRRNLAALAAERGDHGRGRGSGARCSPNAPATARPSTCSAVFRSSRKARLNPYIDKG